MHDFHKGCSLILPSPGGCLPTLRLPSVRRRTSRRFHRAIRCDTYGTARTKIWQGTACLHEAAPLKSGAKTSMCGSGQNLMGRQVIFSKRHADRRIMRAAWTIPKTTIPGTHTGWQGAAGSASGTSLHPYPHHLAVDVDPLVLYAHLCKRHTFYPNQKCQLRQPAFEHLLRLRVQIQYRCGL